MKTYISMVTGLILMGILQTQAGPPATPKELGERYAQAMVAGNTNLAASCLLPLPAYAPMAIDPDGKFVWKNGEAVFAFGKHQGKPLKDIAQSTPDYLTWITKSDFPQEAKKLVADALKGNFPTVS